jgi:hypothetical protein
MKKTVKSISICLFVFLISSCSERLTAYYPKYEDAVKEGAVKRGWIPGWVPTTATEIHEQHDLDTNNVWVKFTAPVSEKTRITAGLKKLSDTEILKVTTPHPSRTDWWFEGLVQQSPANDNALNAEIYVVKCSENRVGHIALERTTDKVYYWCAN